MSHLGPFSADGKFIERHHEVMHMMQAQKGYELSCVGSAFGGGVSPCALCSVSITHVLCGVFEDELHTAFLCEHHAHMWQDWNFNKEFNKWKDTVS